MMTKTLMMKMLIVVATLIILNSGWRSAKALILHTAFTQLGEVPDDDDDDDDERVIGVCCKIVIFLLFVETQPTAGNMG